MKALSFQSTQFDIIDRNGQPWLQSRQIASALGYVDEKSINRIYARNADEFTDSMSCGVKLTSKGQQREVRIFSLRGAHLIAMFSRTKVAKEFRKWVLDLLDKETQPTLPSLMQRRWLITFDHEGKEHVRSVPDDAVVMTPSQLLSWLADPERIAVDADMLFQFVAAASERLRRMHGYQAAQLKRARDAGLQAKLI
ncbi:MAG: BRO family protein [Desulfuromonas sp.]|nr:BRO family protein [Desulfuromonas sp.]